MTEEKWHGIVLQ